MSLAHLLVPEAIMLHLEAKTAADVITTLGSQLQAQGYVREDFVEATLAREAKTPTGLPLGGGINAAIPHVDLEYVRQSAVALATLAEPVSFYNMVTTSEAVAVQLVIMLALADAKSQIKMLQEVATILQKPEIVAALVQANTRQDVLAIVAELDNLP